MGRRAYPHGFLPGSITAAAPVSRMGGRLSPQTPFRLRESSRRRPFYLGRTWLVTGPRRPDSVIEDPETKRQLWKYSRPTVSLVSDRIPSCLYGFGGLTRLGCPTNSPNAALIPLRCGEWLPAAKRLSRRHARADGTGHTWLRLRHVDLELAACPSPNRILSSAKRKLCNVAPHRNRRTSI